MKKYTVNFRMQSVKTANKPIQVMLNLNTKDKSGKYLSIIKSTGIVIEPENWDDNIKRCKTSTGLFNTQINKQLQIIERFIMDNIKFYLNFTDDQIIKEYDSLFLQIVLDAIKKSKGEPTSEEILIKDLELSPYSKKEVVKEYTIDNAITFLIKQGVLPEKFSVDNNLFKKPETNQNFTDYWENQIDNWIREKTISSESRKNYISSINLFREFETEVNKKPFLIFQLNKYIVKEYGIYLNSKDAKKKKFADEFKGFRISTLSKHKTRFKQILNHLQIEDDIDLSINTKINILKKKTEKTYDIALSKKELVKLNNADFSQVETPVGYRIKKFKSYIKELEFYRDSFLVGVLAGGCRVSDLKRIQDVRINDNGKYILKYKSEKTDFDCEVDLPDYFITVFNRVKGKLNLIDDVRYNSLLSIIGLNAGLTENIYIQITNQQNNNKKQTLKKPIYTLLGTHTARRSSITLLYEGGMKPTEIMDVAGIDSINTLENYIKTARRTIKPIDIDFKEKK